MIFYDPSLEIDLQQFGIEIPIIKRGHRIESELEHGRVQKLSLLKPLISDLSCVHDKDYIERLFSDQLKQEVIQTFELQDKVGAWHRYHPDRAKLSLSQLGEILLKRVSGSLLAANLLQSQDFVFYLGGGMHHAFADRGRGFCLVHDVMAGAHIHSLKGERVLIIDLDVHKGDGTALLCQRHSNIHCLSIHMKRGWPLNGEEDKLVYTPSDWDIPIDSGEEHLYLEKLEKALFYAFKTYPDISKVWVLAGTDPYEKDELPSSQLLNLSLEQMLQRDLLVYRYLRSKSLPQAWVLSGGYGKFCWEPTVNFLQNMPE